MIYKLYKTIPSNVVNAATTVGAEPQISFSFDPANSDFANFKAQINEGTAELQDAEGNLMTAEAAREFVATLP